LEQFIKSEVDIELEFLLVFLERKARNIISVSEYFPVLEMVAFRSMAASNIHAPTTSFGLDEFTRPMSITEVL